MFWWLVLTATVLGISLRISPYRTKFIVYYLIISFLAVFCIPFFAVFNPCDTINCYRSSKVLRLVSHIVGIQWEVRGIDNLSRQRACVAVANHQNSFDVLGMFWIWEWMKKCSAVAKKEIFYAWPFGLALWLSGTTFIDRLNSKQAKEQLKNASRKMAEEGVKLWFFPEGTRNKNRRLAPFKKGAFHVAIACQAPIMPVVYSPYYFINHHNGFFGSGKVIITALSYIETKGLTLDDIDELQTKVWNQMNEVYNNLSKELKISLPTNHPGLVGFE
ncbi:1-acyl-sn-glycerol-3-phosphate acyltransferase beta-like [Neocloeon triangulifer]|uniref:1-acyl-sn-glycerol-3-phosphate acyltransferase beta-like n=1 Tax=Neocloeon triangulifer TaxID=2078957 RepID=UPI00286F9C89|nr:1-acyl-sn-glycerol-3-phosphate acyltransferase beta-like [Neocloeon triangulifer]